MESVARNRAASWRGTKLAAVATASLGLFVACSAPGGADGTPIGTESSAVTVCGQDTVHGIDVSHYQNTIDWKAMKAGGVDFAFAKSTEGTTFTDPMFATNWAGMKAAGVVRGAYHFFRANEDPAAQATFALKTIGALGAGDLPIALDLETTDGETEAAIIAAAKQFMTAVETATGRTPILYVSHKFLSDFSAFAKYPLWDAHPDVACADVPTAWATWTFWQRSWKGSIAGVSPLDLDTFNGTLAQLVGGGGTDAGGPPPADGAAPGDGAVGPASDGGPTPVDGGHPSSSGGDSGQPAPTGDGDGSVLYSADTGVPPTDGADGTVETGGCTIARESLRGSSSGGLGAASLLAAASLLGARRRRTRRALAQPPMS